MVTSRTLADGAVSGNSFTVGVDTAVSAGTDALEVSARLLGAALAVRLAFVTTACQWTTSVSWQASTDSLVVSNVALSIGSTGRWVASFLWVGNSAGAERIASVARWAGADWNVVANIAVGVNTTGAGAGVDTVLVHTALVAAALAVVNALDLDALAQGIPGVSRQASADGPHTAVDAVGPDSTSVGPTGHQIVGDRSAMLVQVAAQVITGIIVAVTLTFNAAKRQEHQRRQQQHLLAHQVVSF